ncbi:hypothetical protein FLT15_16485 [Paenibacillus thiaminolyticus]|uniref:hypothetical protein n=1 Tax=Paenibacillus thiaminolyticus TaxID=49283 RepID=UPI0011646C48|nr:hypothetical protein [Paenibacillus thiaminolyticus]NGP56804.1 hypothetical protein [Paenibacillus thiaminolyticus]NGP59903.1 hypothetical protein [Paenibacillus thiaminolyticus]
MTKVQGTMPVEIEITKRELGWAIMGEVLATTGIVDDAGCDWLTDDSGNTFIANNEWHVSSIPIIAEMVDVSNYFRYGKALKVEREIPNS